VNLIVGLRAGIRIITSRLVVHITSNSKICICNVLQISLLKVDEVLIPTSDFVYIPSAKAKTIYAHMYLYKYSTEQSKLHFFKIVIHFYLFFIFCITFVLI
jgi:hypothetical protein